MLCDSDICVFDIRRDFWCMPNVHSEEFRLHVTRQSSVHWNYHDRIFGWRKSNLTHFT